MRLLLCLLCQVLTLAAQELSKPITGERTPAVGAAAAADLTPYPGDDPAEWRDVVEKRIQSKTRRLRKVVTHMFSFLSV